MAGKSIAVVLNLKDAFSTPMSKIATKLNTTGKDAKKFERDLKKANYTLKNFGKDSLKNIQNASFAIAGVGTALIGVVSVATKKTLDYAKEVKKMQRLTGESVENASKMVAVGKKYGISADSMAKGLRMLGIKAVNGGKDFKKYGLNVKDSHGQLLSASEILEKVADKYKQLGGGLKGAIFAQKLMGKGAMELLPLLAKGSKGLQTMEADAKRMGFVLTKDNLKAFSEFSEAQKRYNQAMQGIYITIGSKVLPILGQLGEKVNVAITKFDFSKVGALTTQAFNCVGNTIRFVVSNLKIIVPLLTTAIGLFTGFKILYKVSEAIIYMDKVTKALAVTQGIWNAMMMSSTSLTIIGNAARIVWTAITKGIIVAQTALTVSTYGLNLALLPIIGGFIGAVAVGVLVYKNWDFLCKKASELWEWLKKIGSFFVGTKTLNLNIKKPELKKNELNLNAKPMFMKSYPKHALGTSYFSGGLTGINERGGEIIDLPNGTRITPHDVSVKQKQGIVINLGGITIQGNVIGNKQYADELAGYITRKLKKTLAIM